MNIVNIIKKQKMMIVLAVFLVTLAAIGVSYAVFFDVKGGNGNQVVKAGVLKVTLNGISTLKNVNVLSNSSGLSSTPISYTVQNPSDGTLPATYKIYLYAMSGNQVSLDAIMISNDGNGSSGSTYKAASSLSKVTSIDGVAGNYYLIDSGKVAVGGTTVTKYLRLWVNEDSNLISNNQTIKLGLYVVSEVDESA